MRGSIASQVAVPAIGFAMLAGTLAWGVAMGAFPAWLLAMGAVAIATILFGLFRQEGGSLRDSVASVAYSAFFAICAAFAYLIAANHSQPVDLTRTGVHSLSEQTRAYLSTLSVPIRLTVFSSPDRRDEYGDFLARYQALSPLLQVHIADPSVEVELARSFDSKGVYPGEAFVETVDSPSPRRQRFAFDAHDRFRENTVTNALLRLERGKDEKIYVVDGRGGRPLEAPARVRKGQPDTSLSKFAEVAARQAMTVGKLNLASVATVPEDAACLVIAGPETDLPPAEAEVLRAYLDEGGSLMVLLEPMLRRDLEALMGVVAEGGLQSPNGVLVDSAPGAGNPVSIAVRPVGEHPIVEGTGDRIFPMGIARSVRGTADAKERSREIAPLLVTNRTVWNEDPAAIAAERATVPDNPEDIRSWTVAAASTWPAAVGSRRPMARMVLCGDSDFLTNDAPLTDEGAVFALQSLNWLTMRDDRLAIPPRVLPPSQFTLTAVRFWTIVGSLALLSLALLAGGTAWTLARRRTG